MSSVAESKTSTTEKSATRKTIATIKEATNAETRAWVRVELVDALALVETLVGKAMMVVPYSSEREALADLGRRISEGLTGAIEAGDACRVHLPSRPVGSLRGAPGPRVTAKTERA